MRKFLIAVAALASLFAVATVAQGNTVTSPQGQVQTMTASHSAEQGRQGDVPVDQSRDRLSRKAVPGPARSSR